MKINTLYVWEEGDFRVELNGQGQIDIQKYCGHMAHQFLSLDVYELEKIVRYVEAQGVIAAALNGGGHESK